MAIQEVRDNRKEYADMLREIAADIEAGPVLPMGLMVQVFWNTPENGVSGFQKHEPGFNHFVAGGLFLRLANEHTSTPGKQ